MGSSTVIKGLRRRATGRRTRALLVLTVVTVAVPACSGDGSGDSGAAPPPSKPSPAAGSGGPASPSSVSPSGGGDPTRQCDRPHLEIVTPGAGTRVRSPFRVTYRTDCFRLGPGGGTIELQVGGLVMDLRPRTPEGTVTVPDHPMLSGRRTLVFRLMPEAGAAPGNREARVVVDDVTIEGSR